MAENPWQVVGAEILYAVGTQGGVDVLVGEALRVSPVAQGLAAPGRQPITYGLQDLRDFDYLCSGSDKPAVFSVSIVGLLGVGYCARKKWNPCVG